MLIDRKKWNIIKLKMEKKKSQKIFKYRLK